MADVPLRERVDGLVEELLQEESDEAAALISVLLTTRIALREKRLPGLAEVAWGFVDRQASTREARADARQGSP
ncbi:MAG: hypothetical protein P4L84_17740 [Isosphaeraceae bacterium]|nr:hypothetical protein [Isosphaeraceae bacterium]